MRSKNCWWHTAKRKADFETRGLWDFGRAWLANPGRQANRVAASFRENGKWKVEDGKWG